MLVFGSAQPALQAAMLTIVDPSKRGVANASFFTAFDLGIGLGAILLGVVSQMFGYRILFAGSAISGINSFNSYFVIFVKQRLGKKDFETGRAKMKISIEHDARRCFKEELRIKYDESI